MKFKYIAIVLVLIISIGFLIVCVSKEENSTTDKVDSSILLDNTLDENKVDEFKDKYKDKMPWGGSSENNTEIDAENKTDLQR